jgi:hypothetical protein
MKLPNKYIKFIPALFMFASVSMAGGNSNNPADYRVIALDSCDIVSDMIMTQEQLDAYLPLKNAEYLIEDLHKPLENMEGQLKEYTDRIEEITMQAVQETDDSIYIDKHFLAEQLKLVAQVESIVDLHQLDIDAIEEYGEEIGEKAHAFEKAIKSELGGIDYDHIRIIEKGNDYNDDSCFDRNL